MFINMNMTKKRGAWTTVVVAAAMAISAFAITGTASASVGTSVNTVVQQDQKVCTKTVVETKFNLKEKMIKGRWDGDTFTGDVNASYAGGYGWKTVDNQYFAPDAWPTEDDPTFTKGDFIHDIGGTWYWTIYQQWDNSGGTREVQVPTECPLPDPSFVRVTFFCVTTQEGPILNTGTNQSFGEGEYVFRVREENGIGTDYTAGVGGAGLWSGHINANETTFVSTGSQVAGVSVKTTPVDNAYKCTASTNTTECLYADPPVVLDVPTVSITCSAVTIVNPNDSSLFATIIEPDAFTDGIEIAGGTSLVLAYPDYDVSELYVYVGDTDYYQNSELQYPENCDVSEPVYNPAGSAVASCSADVTTGEATNTGDTDLELWLNGEMFAVVPAGDTQEFSVTESTLVQLFFGEDVVFTDTFAPMSCSVPTTDPTPDEPTVVTTVTPPAVAKAAPTNG